MTTLAITRRSAGDNFRAGRHDPDDPDGKEWIPDQIVIHVTEGDRGSVRSWFANDGSDVSAHYMVTTDGTVDRFVEERDTAFHCGRVARPTAPLVLARKGVNPNLYSIGIEHEGTGKAPLTEKQAAASGILITEIAQRWSIPLQRRHIVGHHEIYAEKSCPGAISVDVLVAELAPSQPKRPVVVWSNAAGDYLVVTRVRSDTDWEYAPMGAVRRGAVQQATVPLSAMPLVAP